MNQQSLTPVEVAEQLQIAKNTVYELIKRGELPAYKVGRKVRIDAADLEAYKNRGKGQSVTSPPNTLTADPIDTNKKTLIISGESPALPLLISYLRKEMPGYQTLLSSSNCYTSLVDLYMNKAGVAATNLWSKSNTPVPYTNILLPSTPIIIIRLAKVTKGFYVKKGNPKNIHDWADLQRPFIKIVNREKGSSSRILMEEKLRELEIDPLKIVGYDQSLSSDVQTATSILQDNADCAVGNYNSVKHFDTIEFIPLQDTYEDLIIKKSDMTEIIYQVIFDILNREDFKASLSLSNNCDTTETGVIIYES